VRGEQQYYIRKKSSWKSLKDFCEDRYIPISEALKTLREIYGLTRKELASKLKMKASAIKRIEEDKLNETSHKNEKILRKIFWAIVSKKK
jgi:ribosome-binding protein aMBF1 (putative translation factor)